MCYHEANTYDQLLTAVPCDQALDLAYITFLIDGPFRAFRDRIFLEQHEDKYYLRCDKLDTWPANVLFNFCIATRTPIEFPHVVKAWGQLAQAGVNEALAIILASKFTFLKLGSGYNRKRDVPEGDPWDWKLDQFEGPLGHFWFDPVSKWTTLINGLPLIAEYSRDYRSRPPEVTPTNKIWGLAEKDVLLSMIGLTVREITEKLDLTKSGVSVIDQMIADYKMPKPAILDFADDFDDDDNFDEDDDDFDEDEDPDDF